MIDIKKIKEKIEWVKNNAIPDSLYLKEITNAQISLELILEFVTLCEIELINMNIGYTLLINLNDSRYNEFEFLGLPKIKKKLAQLIEYDSANITFFNKDNQNISKNYSLEVHKYKINDLISYKNTIKFNFFYLEVRINETSDFQRNILIEIC